MTDLVEVRMGLRPIGPVADPIARAYLRRLLRIRSSTIRTRAEHG